MHRYLFALFWLASTTFAAAQPLPNELLRELCKGDAPEDELYDFDADPWVVRNLTADPAHTATLACLCKEFSNWHQATDDRDVHPRTIARRTKK